MRIRRKSWGLIPLLVLGSAWANPPEPPPKEVQLVLTQPDYPFPVPGQLVIDIESPRELPFNARSSDDKISPGVTTAGLPGLNVSGSGQFCIAQFYELQKTLLDRTVTIVDLRAEPHAFINNMAVSWGPLDQLPDVAPTKLETQYLAAALAGHNVTATAFAIDGYTRAETWEPIELRIAVREPLTEPELVAHAYWDYVRFGVVDFAPPTDATVERFVRFIAARDPATWLHLHCDSGLGRTTLFLTMIDMMANSSRAPAADLIERQYRLGGTNLRNTSDRNAKRAAGKRARLQFIEDFHRYCRDAAPSFTKSWSAWHRADANLDAFRPPGQPRPTPEPLPPPGERAPF